MVEVLKGQGGLRRASNWNPTCGSRRSKWALSFDYSHRRLRGSYYSKEFAQRTRFSPEAWKTISMSLYIECCFLGLAFRDNWATRPGPQAARSAAIQPQHEGALETR